ncbi:MAG: adenine nucleotide alpha hydrolase [Gammaproteobacteria bacterium]|jgi:pyridinium-3,5-biscarboxylic acid mononucleotide sulfurtransferase|nr:adenine nucleotide alpha hydrolase [Gammaproteobacteria bacterium]MBT7372095.1 adenine nucleotide alpha hydrolase [Gammaproteobacteria bacterium]
MSKPAMAIAVSGGVDSMTLAFVAHRANPGTQVFHAISPAVPVEATARVERYAGTENWHLNLIDAGEMHDEEYLANPVNRCYFCKTNLYDTVCIATSLVVASGTNMDDLGDYRPGLVAAEEHKVCHPYVELGISKSDLRKIAGRLGLDDLKDLPAAPCLSSRVTTGIAIDGALLPVIDEAERGVRERLQGYLDLKAVRCRIRQTEVAIQIESAQEFDPHAACFIKSIDYVRRLFEEKGFGARVSTIVVEPYRMGSAFLIDTLEVAS